MIVGPVRAGERADALPDLLGDERHQRMQQAQRRLEHLEQRAARAALQRSRQRPAPAAPASRARGTSRRTRTRRIRRSPAPRGRSDRRRSSRAPTATATPSRPRIQRSATVYVAVAVQVGRVLLGVHQHVARGVPQLVAEVAVALDAAEVEADVAAHGRERGEGEAQRVGAVGRNALRKLLARRLLDRRSSSAAASVPSCAWRPARRGRCRRSGRAGR